MLRGGRKPSGKGRGTSRGELERLQVRLEDVAAGGYCVARHQGQVVFVRGGIPGELVHVQVLQRKKKLLFAQVVDVLEASRQRVSAPEPFSVSGGVGAFELAHMSLAAQHEYKTRVFAQQARRLGGEAVSEELAQFGFALPADGVSASFADGVASSPVAGATAPQSSTILSLTPATFETLKGLDLPVHLDAGLGYRVRVDVEVLANGRLAMSAFRAGQRKIPVAYLPFAHPLISDNPIWNGVNSGPWQSSLKPGRARLWATSEGLRVYQAGHVWGYECTPEPKVFHVKQGEQAASVLHQVCDRQFKVAADGFWQAHVCAPTVFSEHVQFLLDGPYERVLELFSGSGLFTPTLLDALAPTGRILTVEGSEQAVHFARENVSDTRLSQVSGWIDAESIESFVARLGRPDVVILDPPRAGAGPQVLRALADCAHLIYISCDQAALMRDLKEALALGYSVADLRVYDAFSHTHHVESIVSLRRA